jgi:hypothetical protein
LETSGVRYNVLNSDSAGAARVTRGVTRVEITSSWSIELDSDFFRRVDEGDLVLWKPGRTVYAAVYWTDVSAAEEAIARMLEGRPGVPRRTFDRAEPGICGHAYLLPEGEGPDRYWGLNTWTATRKSVACVTFYFHHPHDLPWALRAWESVRCGVGAVRNLN